MQTIWSRVAPAQSACRCRVCLHSTHAIVRRSTTAASRRKFTGSDLFTACYTTILGTAVFLDSMRKNTRRKELDEKLERARASLSSLAVQEAPRSPKEYEYQVPTNQAGSGTGDETSDRFKQTRDMTAFLDELANYATTRLGPQPRTAWSRHQLDWGQVDAEILAEENNPDIYLRHPKDQQQLERTTKTIESLVQTLLWRVRNSERLGLSKAQGAQGDSFLEEAEGLMGDFPSYTSPDFEPAVAENARAKLSETFRKILANPTDVKEAVGRICYNLLLSTTPPNIHNYNTLIVGFNRIRRPDLAQDVIDSYLDRTKWPATEQTLICLLNHAMVTDDSGLFREAVDRMRGTVEDGVHLRIFDREALQDGPVLDWIQQCFAARKYAYVQKAHRTQDVFNSMIRGWLQFGRVDVASMSFVACVRNQFLVPVDTIHELLTQCLATVNWRTARTMLDRLGRDIQKFEMLLDHIVNESSAQMASDIGELFCALFNMCGVNFKPVFSSARKNVLQLLNAFQDQVSTTGPGRNNVMKSLARITSLAKEVAKMKEKTKRLEAHLKVFLVECRTGYNLNAKNRLPPIDWPNRGRQDQYPPLLYALRVIHFTTTMTTQNCVKLQLLSRLPNQAVATHLEAAANLENLSMETLISFYHPCQNQSPEQVVTPQGTAARLERRATEIEQNIQAILFCQLTSTKQRHYRVAYKDWYSMPVERLFKHVLQPLKHRVLKQRAKQRYLEYVATAQDQNNEIDEAVDGSTKVSDQGGSSWAGEIPSTHAYVEIPLPVAKSAAKGVSEPRQQQQTWSDEHLDVTTYQRADASY